MFPVEVFRTTVEKVVSLFRSHGIRFHLTGGITSSYYGEPRYTQDIDIVVDPVQLKAKLTEFFADLSKTDFMYNEREVRRAIEAGSQFQLLDSVECLKLDIYPRELVIDELTRSEPIEVFQDMILPVASRIDSAVSKLIWISHGSHKSRKDLRVIFGKATEADKSGIRILAERMSLADLLTEVLNEPDEYM